MKDLYDIAGISKQALWKYDKRQEASMSIIGEVLDIIRDVRTNHKRMGCRRIYYTSKKSLPIGRDIFERIGFANGYKLKLKRNVMKTTWSQRMEVFPNLIEGMVLNGINQLWQSDIFYLKIEGANYYGVSIEDVYSRKLLALHLSQSLSAQQNVKALKKALVMRKGSDVSRCILHSDRGSQYAANDYKAILAEHGFIGSMSRKGDCWDNAVAESFFHTLKVECIRKRIFTSREEAKRIIFAWIETRYNRTRRHSTLDYLSPFEYERQYRISIKNVH